MKKHTLFILLFFVVLLTACNKCNKETSIVLVEEPEMINEEVNELLRDKLKNIDTSHYLLVANDTLYATKQLFDFYTLNNYKITWTDKGKYTANGDTLVSIIKNASVYGLIPEDYHFSKINTLIKTGKNNTTKKFDAVKFYEADVLMTDAFFTFLVHVSKGRINIDSLTAEWHPEKLDTNLVAILSSSLKTNCIRETIDAFEPQSKQYQLLKKALGEFKNEFAGISWDSIAPKETDSTTFKERVKQRLIQSHDYYDEYTGSDSIKLVKAIKNFQCKHNLVEDGKVGKLTFKAMQQTKQDYIHQIEVNMEYLRLMDVPTEKQFILVNIPKYEMRVIEEDTLVMKSRVIVGAPKTKTPLLKSTIRYMTIYPYWTVPFSIIIKETLPILKRDTSYIRRKRFEVLDWQGNVIDHRKINWKKYSKNYFPFRIRQRIGDDNSLGVLKFNFNNKYGVYMHDTDNRRLFNKESRSLSHGCVRLEKFVELAQFLIRDDSVRYPKDSLMFDLFLEEQKQVNLRRPVPIYINYFTVEVDENNNLYFFIDIYGRDEKTLKVLYKKK